jgi:hypothetical protein
MIQTLGSFAKSEDVLGLSTSIEAFFKAQNEDLSKRFQALGSIYKSQVEENIELKKSLSDINGQLALVTSAVSKLENTPQQRRSVPTNVAAVNRFEKSQDANTTQISVSDKGQLRDLSTHLFEQIELIKSQGGPQDSLLQNAISQIEIAGGFDAPTVAALQPRLRRMNIELVP